MRIIDLLNKIANGEEVPKKIHYNCLPLYWCEPCKIYETMTDGGIRGKNLYTLMDNLNDEVEIIEEEKKIPEKLENLIMCINNINTGEMSSAYRQYDFEEVAKHNFEIIHKKFNELIDYLNSKGE